MAEEVEVSTKTNPENPVDEEDTKEEDEED